MQIEHIYKQTTFKEMQQIQKKKMYILTKHSKQN